MGGGKYLRYKINELTAQFPNDIQIYLLFKVVSYILGNFHSFQTKKVKFFKVFE